MIESKHDGKENKKNPIKSSGTNGAVVQPLPPLPNDPVNGMLTEDILQQNRQKFAMKISSPNSKKLKT